MKKSFSFQELKWDTEFFGIKSAKATLYSKLSLKDWKSLISKMKNYEFVSIVNKNSEAENSQWIGKNTNSFLVDVNIQFKKRIDNNVDFKPVDVIVYNNVKRNEQILELTNFPHSKFIDDPELKKRGGKHVYYHWVNNSFERKDKFFAISLDENQKVNGFSLFSFLDSSCVIELIAVSEKQSKRGIGNNLFKAVEFECSKRKIYEIKVGTQVKNHRAINFYHKQGCKHVATHQIFHLWNEI